MDAVGNRVAGTADIESGVGPAADPVPVTGAAVQRSAWARPVPVALHRIKLQGAKRSLWVNAATVIETSNELTTAIRQIKRSGAISRTVKSTDGGKEPGVDGTGDLRAVFLQKTAGYRRACVLDGRAHRQEVAGLEVSVMPQPASRVPFTVVIAATHQNGCLGISLLKRQLPGVIAIAIRDIDQPQILAKA